MNQKINQTQLDYFRKLVSDINKKGIDVQKIEELIPLPLFKSWKNFLKMICGKQIIKEDNKTINQTHQSHLHDLLLAYNAHGKTRFNKKVFDNIFKKFFTYLEKEQNRLYYFSPVYNFEYDDELEIDEFIKIRKISPTELDFLIEHYDGFTPIKVALSTIKYVFVINIEKTQEDPLSFVTEKIFQVLNKFKLLKRGDIHSGGLYNFDKSENWNPKNKFHRILVEPIGIVSNKKYSLQKKYSKKFKFMLTKINNLYPGIINDELKANQSLLKKEHTKHNYFDRAIRRFAGALETQNKNEKIVDFVLSLEILLVSSVGDNTMKISQRTAQFIGKNDMEKLKIWQHMMAFYNFRSGQVHEFEERPMDVENLPSITKDDAIKKLDNWTRRAILQMIFLYQEKEYSKLTFKQIFRKIEASMFDKKTDAYFLKFNKELSKQSKFS